MLLFKIHIGEIFFLTAYGNILFVESLNDHNPIAMSFFRLLMPMIFFVLLISCQTSTGNPPSKKVPEPELLPIAEKGTDGTLTLDTAIFQKRIISLKKYAAANGYSTQYAMLLDFALHSGSKRFFVVQLNTGKIIKAGLVTHGSSPTAMQDGERQYSNANGSLCTSLGKYKIGVHYQGTYGLAYKLHGLDTSNNHAFSRAVVLHSHSCVPDTETPQAICQSWGCPTVSPDFLTTIAGYIDKSAKPVLMEMYDSGL